MVFPFPYLYKKLENKVQKFILLIFSNANSSKPISKSLCNLKNAKFTFIGIQLNKNKYMLSLAYRKISNK